MKTIHLKQKGYPISFKITHEDGTFGYSLYQNDHWIAVMHLVKDSRKAMTFEYYLYDSRQTFVLLKNSIDRIE